MNTHNPTPSPTPSPSIPAPKLDVSAKRVDSVAEDQRIEAVMRLADAYATSGSPIYDLSSAARNALRAAIASQLADAQAIIDRLERERDEAIEFYRQAAEQSDAMAKEFAALKSAQPADVARDAALEEAAQLCDALEDGEDKRRAAEYCAEKIRALAKGTR